MKTKKRYNQKEVLSLIIALILAYTGIFVYSGYVLGSAVQQEECLMELRYRDAKIRFNLTHISNNQYGEFAGVREGKDNYQLIRIYDNNTWKDTRFMNKSEFPINPMMP